MRHLLLLALLTPSGSLLAVDSQPWKCTIEAEFQCTNGKSDAISRSAVGQSKETAEEKAKDAARIMACQPLDGPLSYFKILTLSCVKRP